MCCIYRRISLASTYEALCGSSKIYGPAASAAVLLQPAFTARPHAQQRVALHAISIIMKATWATLWLAACAIAGLRLPAVQAGAESLAPVISGS